MKTNSTPSPRLRLKSLIGAAMILSALAIGSSASAQVSSATLHLIPNKFDFAGSRQFGLMYFPSRIDLSPVKPAGIKKEPAYKGRPLYGSVKLGNGPHSVTWFAVDSDPGVDPSIYFDKNHDGDLTDDGTFPVTLGKKQDNGVVEYSGTYLLPASWGTATKETSSGTYGLNFYWAASRTVIYYYRAAALTGTITLEGKPHEVTIVENDNDGLFDKRFDHTSPDKHTMSEFMFIDRDQYDVRGTFGYDDTNYVATLSPDGSKLTMQPTAKVIKAPAVKVDTTKELLPVGTEAPEFRAFDLAGKPVDLKDLRGKTVVLKFWATWCGPCMASMPHFAEIQKEVQGQNVELLAVCVDDDLAAFKTWVASKQSQYGFRFAFDPAARDQNSSLLKPYNVTGIPATFVIDKTGKISAAISGYSQGDKSIENALVKLGVSFPDMKPMIGLGSPKG